MHTHKKYGLNEYSSKYGIVNVEWRGISGGDLTQSNKNKLRAVTVKDNSTAYQNKTDKYVDLNG